MTDVADTEPTEPSQVVEHLFRHEAAKMVATLTRIFGLEHLSLAEDVVQEALARALQTWPFHGVPKNPAAWIMRASRNLALDAVRREKVFHNKEAEIVQLMDGENPGPEALFTDAEIADDRLRMMFVCCHPLIPQDSQAALALKILCGFGPLEIGRAFLTTEAAVAKRITRAKQKIREAQIKFEIPPIHELSTRLDGVLQTIYLLFNEGYKASSGDKLIREDICLEAIRLAELLVGHPTVGSAKTHALLSLMLLNAARFPARVDEDGHLLLLQAQDRSLWDMSLIARGMFHLACSATGEEIGEYHVQAGIAACHCRAANYAATDWVQILELYDRLVEFDDSPIVALNRAVAMGEVRGPKAALDAVAAIDNIESLESYYLLHAVMGELEVRLGNVAAASQHYRRSLQLAEIRSERVFLAGRIQHCEAHRGTDSIFT